MPEIAAAQYHLHAPILMSSKGVSEKMSMGCMKVVMGAMVVTVDDTQISVLTVTD